MTKANKSKSTKKVAKSSTVAKKSICRAPAEPKPATVVEKLFASQIFLVSMALMLVMAIISMQMIM